MNRVDIYISAGQTRLRDPRIKGNPLVFLDGYLMLEGIDHEYILEEGQIDISNPPPKKNLLSFVWLDTK